MSRNKQYDYQRIDRSRMQDDWYLQRRREITASENAIQAKLDVSEPGDTHEQQADTIARQVINGGNVDMSLVTPVSNAVQSKSESSALTGGDTLQSQLSSSKGSGQSLDALTKSEMESKMGADLGGVKIHTGSEAHSMSESINAKAFTHGQDIYFKNGNYNPSSDSGKELLAHELVHTVQQGNGFARKVQRQDDDDFKHYYNIAIPPGTTSKEGFRHYAEMIIFGRVVDLNWAEPGSGLAAIYDDIANHIGETVQFGVWDSELKKYGGNVPEADNTDAVAGYNGLKGNDKKEIVDEINRRYYDRTGIKPGTVIQPGDANNAAVWNKIRDEVMREKLLIDNLPPDIKKFIHIENGVKPEDYEKYATIAELLSQFNSADFLDYQAKVNFETTDLDLAALQLSLEKYLKGKAEKETEAGNFESLKTKLYGLEELYKQYKEYLKWKTVTDSIAYLTQLEDSLNKKAKENGFKNFDEFLKYVDDYEKAFEASTVRLAEDHLYRYQHTLFLEKKRLADPAYITQLYNSLKASGASDHFANANENQSAANSILGDDAKYASHDKEDKQKLQATADAERSMGQYAIKSLDSQLVKEDQFDTEGFSEVSSEAEMKQFLESYLFSKQQSLDETWSDIHKHPDHIYELDVLLAASIKAQNIQPGSIFDMIIKDKAEEINEHKILKAVCFTIIGLVLTIVTFGAAGPVAIAAGIASAGISLYGVYEAAEEYKRNNAANDVGLLTDDPSLFWVMLAIGGAVVDLAALTSAFKVAKPLAAATKEFNTTMDVEKLEKDMLALIDLDKRLQQNILKQARIQAQEDALLKGLAATRGLVMATIPGLAQTGELVARAIFAIRKGIVSIDSFIAELKAAKIIGDTGLNPDELLLVKNAFTKGKTLATDEKLVADIEKAIVEKDFVKLKQLTETNTLIKGAPLSEEVQQARTIGDYLGGGEFEFLPSKKGVEGFLNQGGKEIPISLKEYTGEIKSFFRKIRDNGNKIAEEALTDSRIITGTQPNTVMYAEIVNFSKEEIMNFISTNSTNVLPQGNIFSKVVFKTNDGQIFTIPLQ